MKIPTTTAPINQNKIIGINNSSNFLQGFLTFKNVLTLIAGFLNLLLLIKVSFFYEIIIGITPLLDFDIYYRLSGDLIKGLNPYGVDYMRSWGPPSVFIYYLPLQAFNLQEARSVTTIINISSGIAICIILAKKLFNSKKLLAFLILTFILFSSFPARFSIEMGQPNLVITLLITVLLFARGKFKKAILLSLIISLKAYLALTLVAFLKRRSKTVKITLLAIISIAILFSPLIKPSLYYYFTSSTFPTLITSTNSIGDTDYYNQSYFSSLARVGVILTDKSIYSFVLIIGITFIYLLSSFEIAVVLSLLLSIISWQHYFVILFPIYIKAFKNSPHNVYDWLFISILILFWWIEFPWLHTARLTTFTGLLASHYFLSAFLLAIYIPAIRWLTSGNTKSYNTLNEN